MMTRPGLLLGIGLGGFVDGILLHQILQWHHMLTSEGSYPASTVAGLETNTLWDGLFHLGTWIATTVGLWLLWQHMRQGAPLGRAATAGSHAGRLGHVQSRRRRHRPPHPRDPSRQGWRRSDRIGPHVPGTRRCLARRRVPGVPVRRSVQATPRCEAIAPRLDVHRPRRETAGRERCSEGGTRLIKRVPRRGDVGLELRPLPATPLRDGALASRARPQTGAPCSPSSCSAMTCWRSPRLAGPPPGSVATCAVMSDVTIRRRRDPARGGGRLHARAHRCRRPRHGGRHSSSKRDSSLAYAQETCTPS